MFLIEYDKLKIFCYSSGILTHFRTILKKFYCCRLTIGLHQDVFYSDGTYKPNAAIKTNNNTKIDSNCSIGFEAFVNVTNTPSDTSSQERFANSRKRSQNFINPTAPKFNDNSVFDNRENIADFKSNFPITITVEDYYDNNNEKPTNISDKLKTNVENNQLKSIVQELVQSR